MLETPPTLNMLHVCIAILIVASTTALPKKDKTLCEKYDYLYQQCLPPYNWVCPSKPIDFTIKSSVISTELRRNPQWLYDLYTSKDCMHDTEPYIPPIDVLEYRKKPVCNTVRELVEYVYRDIKDPMTGVVIGNEVCNVVFSNGKTGPVLQEIYKVSCHGKTRKNPKCDISYTGLKGMYCKPTNPIERVFLVYCPSDNGYLRDMVVKIPTACSCVDVSCANETSIFPLHPNGGGVGAHHQTGGPNQFHPNEGFTFQSLDNPIGMNQNQGGPIFSPIEDPSAMHTNQNGPLIHQNAGLNQGHPTKP